MRFASERYMLDIAKRAMAALRYTPKGMSAKKKHWFNREIRNILFVIRKKYIRSAFCPLL